MDQNAAETTKFVSTTMATPPLFSPAFLDLLRNLSLVLGGDAPGASSFVEHLECRRQLSSGTAVT